MQIDCKAKYGKDLCLGVQTNPGHVKSKAIWLAKKWAPKKAKSFTINSLSNTTYNGVPVKEETGWATTYISYFTTKKEGEYILEKIPSDFEYWTLTEEDLLDILN